MRWEGMLILPSTVDEVGNDSLIAHYLDNSPDVLLILYDAWPFNPDVISQIPVSLWAPIDHREVPPQVADILRLARHPIAMSRHGERAMRAAGGIDPFYVPHAVDTEIYKPIDRQEARKRLDVGSNTFFVVVNGANKGNRKSLELIIKAWSIFTERYHYDGMLLYMHCYAEATHGIDLLACAKYYEVDPKTIRFANSYHYVMGRFSPRIMCDLYNAADVLLQPSRGEGFGVPLIEAQACGTPVITCDATAMSELVGPGYLIAIDAIDDYIYTPMGDEQAEPPVSRIVDGLEWAYAHKGSEQLRYKARAFAMEYDSQYVYSKYMKPALEWMAEVNRSATGTDAVIEHYPQ
jgi:glycosyltransferase involved in cell wall biosynthesis